MPITVEAIETIVAILVTMLMCLGYVFDDAAEWAISGAREESEAMHIHTDIFFLLGLLISLFAS